MLASDVVRRNNRSVVTIEPDRTVLEAIQLLVKERIGALLVRGPDGEIAGIITERDILRESADANKRLGETRVAEVMTTRLLTAGPGQTITELLSVMTRHRVRHLPILEAQNLVGMVSIGDLVKAQLDQMADENRHLRQYIQGERA